MIHAPAMRTESTLCKTVDDEILFPLASSKEIDCVDCLELLEKIFRVTVVTRIFFSTADKLALGDLTAEIIRNGYDPVITSLEVDHNFIEKVKMKGIIYHVCPDEFTRDR